ncbi:MAG: dipeptidase [Bacteroidetes bacterium]|nr:dipeptidase [Bacteroidota bacterium]
MKKKVIILSAFVVALVFICWQPDASDSLIKKALRIHKKAFTVDSHTDTPLDLFRGNADLLENTDLTKETPRVDLKKMKEGGLDAAFFAVFIGQNERTPEGNLKAKTRALAIFDTIFAEVRKYHGQAGIATTPKEAYRLVKEGKEVIFIGIENGYPIGNDLSMIQTFYNLGARYITLCHTKNNDICDSSTDKNGPENNGLSDFGKAVIKEMNRLGIMIDISHASDKTFYDVIASSKVPVIASHSCARALCDSPRNLDDDMLRKLAENGGVIQMCFLSDYLRKPEPNPVRDSAHQALEEKYRHFENLTDEESKQAWQEWHAIDKLYPEKPASVADVVDHIDHVMKVAGIDHIGIGTDFDGGGGVDGCNDASQMANVTIELVKRGYSGKDIRKIWGGNLMRVMQEGEDYASKIK